MPVKSELLRLIPKVDDIVNNEKIVKISEEVCRQIVVDSIRKKIDETRERILHLGEHDLFEVDTEKMIEEIISIIQANNEMNLKRVVNATGVILHTNLGRAPLYHGLKDKVWEIAENYSTLEYNIDTGKRGSRYAHVEEIITKIVGTESALVVNNNAAAVLLILSTLAKGNQVIVSRGELVEIGESFRIPEIMKQSGAELVEVGATNKTHLSDYQDAIVDGKTGALLKVHPSNYRILGFTEEVELSELVKLGKSHGIPVIHDLGSGALIDFRKYGVSGEATVFDSVTAGADIICFSGDKLLGGPQAGIIIGNKALINQMKRNPLTRAFRIDKLTLAALEATLRLYFDQEKAIAHIPTLSMITMPLEVIIENAKRLHNLLMDQVKNCSLALEEGNSQVGGGSMPLQELPTRLIRIKPENIAVQALEEQLRGCQIPIIVRIHKDQIYLDVRTIKEDDFEYIVNIFKSFLNKP